MKFFRISDGRRNAPSCRRNLSRLVALGCCILLLAGQSRSASAGDFVESSGDVLRLAIPAAALALTFKRHDRDGLHQFYKSFGLNVAATWALKQAVDKERPNGRGDDAFPSGHASMAFQGAAFLHRRYGMRTAWPAYALAAYTGWTRIDADRHDETDVIAGALLGFASSMWLVDRLPRVNVALSLDRQIGVRISGHF